MKHGSSFCHGVSVASITHSDGMSRADFRSWTPWTSHGEAELRDWRKPGPMTRPVKSGLQILRLPAARLIGCERDAQIAPLIDSDDGGGSCLGQPVFQPSQLPP